MPLNSNHEKKNIINRKKLIIAPMTLVLIALIILSAIGYISSRRAILAQTENGAKDLAEQIVNQVQGNLSSEILVEELIDEQIDTTIKSITIDLGIINNTQLKTLVESTSIDEINIFSSNGDLLYSSHPEKRHQINVGTDLYHFLNSDKNSFYFNSDDVITGANFRYGVVRLEDGKIVQVGISINRLIELTRQFRLQTMVSRLVINENIQIAQVINLQNKIIASSQLQYIGTESVIPETLHMIQSKDLKDFNTLTIYKNRTMNVAAPIVLNGELLKILLITPSTELTHFHTNQILFILILLSLSSISIFLWIQKRNVINPVQDLVHNISQINLEKERTYRLKLNDSSPFKGFETKINDILNQTEDYFNSLKKEKIALEKSEKKYKELYSNKQDELELILEELISKEKLASLGGLVAGVAHEINTPLGVAITAASLIHDDCSKNMKLFESGQLTKSELQKFYFQLDESVKILEFNLNRTADLVQNFKSIAVNQHHEEKLSFDLGVLLNHLVKSFKHELKKHQVTIDCPENLQINSYPGEFSQIFTNLIMNSIIHGFENMTEGKIHIKIKLEDKNLSILYSDNGIGMDTPTKSKIFDPFFSLKKGNGGTGLGMSIVHNIVSVKLHGRITVESEPNKGTRFSIELKI